MMPEPRVIYANRFESDRDVPWHRHDGAELVLVSAGACRIDVGGAGLEAEGGNLLVLPSNVPQYQASHGRVRTTYAVFQCPRAYFDDSARVVPASAALSRWMEDLADLPGADDRPVADALLVAILAAVTRSDRHQRDTGRRHPAVTAAIAFIDEHLVDRFSVDDVAEHACVSASHLSAVFRKATGTSVLGYAQMQRLDRACRLLTDPLLSVAQVASRCGFDDVNYFVRYFRAKLGRPPGAWRRDRGHGTAKPS
jgi:AraC-like DNA-binding protein